MLEIEKRPLGAGGGIEITPRVAEGQVEPPLKSEEEAQPEVPPEVKVIREGKIPIHPVVIKPLFRFEGNMFAELTGYQGWLYSEEDIQAIADLIQQTGLQATPVWQLILLILGLHAEKGMGWVMWRRKQRVIKPSKEEEKL